MIKKSVFGVTAGAVAFKVDPRFDAETNARIQAHDEKWPRLKMVALSDQQVVRIMRGQKVELDSDLPEDAQFRGFRSNHSFAQMATYVAVFEHPSFDPCEDYSMMYVEVYHEKDG
jgi:hypothetical protein